MENEGPYPYGICVVCDAAITEKRFWAVKSRTSKKPETCGQAHQMVLGVRRSRGLTPKGEKIVAS